MINIYYEVENLVNFALNSNLIKEEDKIYCRNRLLSILKLDSWEESMATETVKYPSEILDKICDWAFENGQLSDNTVTFRDLFDTELMNVFVSKPSEILLGFIRAYMKMILN